MVVSLRRRARWHEAQTARHAKVQEQPAAAMNTFAIKKQILATPQDGVNAQAGQSGGEAGRDFMTEFWRADAGAGDALARQVGEQPLAANFDFGEFWHCCDR